MIIACDFDGTLVEHTFPNIGIEAKNAFDYLKKFKEAGAQLILFTCRGYDMDGEDLLTPAIEFCRRRGVEFDAINMGIGQNWTNSIKPHAHFFIDDRGFGCPITQTFPRTVNWDIVGPEILRQLGNTK